MPTVEQFKEAYPAFEACPDALVQAHLDAAAAKTSSTIWGDQYGVGLMLKAADSLAMTAEGRSMRLVTDEGRSIFYPELVRMRRLVSTGAHRAAGY